MSVRAGIMRFIMRRTIRKQLASFDDVNEMRERMAKYARMVPRLPDGASFVPVSCDGLPCEWVTCAGADQNRVLMYLHGGGYVFGGGLADHRDVAWRLSQAARMRVLLVDYRLAPENPFPAAVDDATACYRWLLEEGHDPSELAIGGDSAGGGLAVATMVNLKNLGLPLPACGILLSPWTDLSASGDSVVTNAKADPVLSPASLHRFADLYAGDLDRRAPLASPLFADLGGLPALMIQVGSTEVLRSDAERLADKIRRAGGEVMLDVWTRMPHVWQIFAARIPEGREAIAKLGEFLDHRTTKSKGQAGGAAEPAE